MKAIKRPTTILAIMRMYWNDQSRSLWVNLSIHMYN